MIYNEWPLHLTYCFFWMTHLLMGTSSSSSSFMPRRDVHLTSSHCSFIFLRVPIAPPKSTIILTLRHQILCNFLPIIFTETLALKSLHKVCIPDLLIMLCTKLTDLLPRLPITLTRRPWIIGKPWPPDSASTSALPTILLLSFFFYSCVGEFDLFIGSIVCINNRYHSYLLMILFCFHFPKIN